MAALGGRFLVEALLNSELRPGPLRSSTAPSRSPGHCRRWPPRWRSSQCSRCCSRCSASAAAISPCCARSGPRAARSPAWFGQAALLGLAGAAAGLATGLAIGLVLVKVVNVQSFGWTLRFLPDWGSLAAAAALVTAACLLAGLDPAFAAARMHPGDALREEG